MQDFRKVLAWKRAHALTLAVMRATRGMPRSGYGTLRNQMLRAAESIPMNIVEGCGASTLKEFARFLDISIKSGNELEYQLQLAHDYGVLQNRLWKELANETVEIRKMTCGFRAAILQAERTRREKERDGQKREYV